MKQLFENMFANRSIETEIMDDLNCEGEVVTRTLKELEIINKWLGGNDVTISALEKCLNRINPAELKNPLSIADLGCGGGDILKLIAQWSKRKKISFALTGVDANPNILDYARKNTEKFPEINYSQSDILSEDFKSRGYDIVNCTLFCHHFNDDALLRLLKQLRQQTNIAIIINDLHRHWLAYHSIKYLTEWFSNSAMVKNDAKLSVLRSFKKNELEKIIKEAGFSDFSIKWKWAFRFEVILWA
jgi:2-polyprenyl-3-methyl-5-hydroxy-6-metoxy-1,4-benzoquinol methylase